MIVPVLNEAAALPAVLSGQPVGQRPRIGRSKVTGAQGGTVRAVGDMRSVLREHHRPGAT